MRSFFQFSQFTISRQILSLFFCLGLFGLLADLAHAEPWGELTLEEPYAHWLFIPEGKFETVPVKFGKGLSNLIPWTQPCCDGEYVGYINAHSFVQSKDLNEAQVGILFPPLGGEVLGLEINGRKLKIAKKDYSVSGAFITLLKQELRSSTLEVRLKIHSGRDFHAGMWNGKPIIGRMNDLIERQQKTLISNSFLPIGYAITCCAIGVFFFLVILASRSKDALFSEFMWLLLAWGVFYLFLSGQMRLWFPWVGRFFYFPVRSLASLCTIRLIATFAAIPRSRITQVCQATLVLISIQIFARYFDHIWIQEISLGLLTIPMGLFILKLSLNANTRIKQIVLGVAALEFFCFLSDSIRLYSFAFQFSYPFPFFERHMAILLILTSLMYIIYQVAQDVTSRVRSEAFEEAASQFVHDIQSPVAALRLASHSINLAPQDALIIISSAIRRLNDISHSLRVFLKEKQLPKNQPLRPLIESIIKEKRFQFQHEEKIRLETHYDEYAMISTVRVQAVEFERLLSNLINNAAEAMDRGGTIKVIVNLKNEQVFIEIADQGKGISPLILSRIGNRGITFGKPSGSGLGLYHAKKAIHSWGGKFDVESQEGEGTRILITLPLSLDLHSSRTPTSLMNLHF